MAMRNTYRLTNTSAAGAGVSISTAITILQLKAGTNYPLELVRASLTQRGSATSVQESVAICRKTAAATVTIAAAGTNLIKMGIGNPTSDVSLGTTATGFTGSGEGTDGDILVERGFNVLNGFEWLATPEERFTVPVGGIIALKFFAAPAAQTWIADLVFRELD